jgi:hypothetical protein
MAIAHERITARPRYIGARKTQPPQSPDTPAFLEKRKFIHKCDLYQWDLTKKTMPAKFAACRYNTVPFIIPSILRKHIFRQAQGERTMEAMIKPNIKIGGAFLPAMDGEPKKQGAQRLG